MNNRLTSRKKINYLRITLHISFTFIFRNFFFFLDITEE